VRADVAGNSFATLNPDGRPRVMLAGHIDEIGVMVSHIDDDGYVSFDTIGTTTRCRGAARPPLTPDR
jgi:endoglucanase